MHRFIPILAHARGARCVEVPVRHHPRRFGQTKYGISRTLRVVLDLITVKYMLDYFASPMKLFGRFGLARLAWSRGRCRGDEILGGVDMTGNPLLLLTVLSSLLRAVPQPWAVRRSQRPHLFCHSAPGKQSYAVRETLNLDNGRMRFVADSPCRVVAPPPAAKQTVKSAYHFSDDSVFGEHDYFAALPLRRCFSCYLGSLSRPLGLNGSRFLAAGHAVGQGCDAREGSSRYRGRRWCGRTG